MVLSMSRTLVQTIEYVTVETDPSRTIPTTDDSGLTFLALSREWEALPDRFRTALADLVDGDPGDPARCQRCKVQWVGWVDDARWTSTGLDYDVTVWRTAVLVSHPDGPVSVQCEECGPDVVTTAVGGSQ